MFSFFLVDFRKETSRTV